MRSKTTNKRKNILSVFVVLVMLMATLLTACSSSETAAAPAKEETPAVETSKKTEPVEEIKEDVAEPKVTTEPETTEEAEPKTTTEEVAEKSELETETETVEDEEEVNEYAQIDMESTLPGIEWIQSFNGIIEEPKLVVFNDSTNKKIILEELQEVEFYDDDTLAVYIPKGRGEISDDYSFEFEEVNYYDSVVAMKKMPSCIRREGYSSARCIDIEFDGEPMTLYCYLKLMGNP